MKKRLLSSILFLFIFTVCLVRANAAVTQYPPLVEIGADLAARAPVVIPANNSTVYSTITDGFDFSKIKFATASGGTIDGKENLKKIIIGNLKASEITNNKDSQKSLDTLLENWFTAYCLDETKKYPGLGLFSSGGYVNTDQGIAVGYSQAVDKNKSNWGLNAGYYPEATEIAIIYAAIMNDSNFSGMLEDLATEFSDLSSVQIITNAGYFLNTVGDSGSVDEYLEYLMKDTTTEVPVGIAYVGFEDLADGSKKVFYAANADSSDPDSYNSEILSNHQESGVTVKVKPIKSGTKAKVIQIPSNLSALAFTKYEAKDDRSISGYNHALWIVENSYPTLKLTGDDNALSPAGVNMDTLKTQIKSLYSLSDSEVDKYVEMCVYGTVQYAIWKATNHSLDGVSLGNSITNCSELNKLYQYLIQDRAIYSGYSNSGTYNNKITLTVPAEGKELAKTTSSEFIYGPFSATYNALLDSDEKINFTITNANSNGIRVTNSSNSTITSLDKGQQFYIAVDKNASVGSVSVNFTLNNVLTFSPRTNRGRIYYPVGALGQNAMSGGRAERTSISGDLTVLTNARTGVQNIALLLMVTLVAFTLGYFVLSYKQKPIELNQ